MGATSRGSGVGLAGMRERLNLGLATNCPREISIGSLTSQAILCRIAHVFDFKV